jgi:hypothetical protein
MQLTRRVCLPHKPLIRFFKMNYIRKFLKENDIDKQMFLSPINALITVITGLQYLISFTFICVKYFVIYLVWLLPIGYYGSGYGRQ